MTKEPITLGAAAQLHREWLLEMKQAPESTIRSITSAYSTLAKWIKPEYDREAMTSDWTPEILEKYFLKYVSKLTAWDNKRQQTINCERWLMRQGYLPYGPPIVEELIPKRGTQSAPRDRRLSDKEFLLLLKAAGGRHARNYFLLLFARLTGRRIGEITAMRWADVRRDEGYIRWDNTKAKRYGRKQAITPEIAALLDAWELAYIKDVKVTAVRADWYLFPATTPQGLAGKGVRRPLILSPLFRISDPVDIIQEAMDDAGIPRDKGDGWHIIRKTAISRARRAARDAGRGDSWDLARTMADHADIKTTRIYVDEAEDVEALHEWQKSASARTLGDEAMAAIPILAGLVEHEQAPAGDAQSGQEVYQMAAVIDMTSRRRLQALP